MGRRESVAGSSFEERRIVEEFEVLKKDIELSKGEGSIIIAVTNSQEVVDRLILKLDSEFKTKIIRVENGQQIVNILKGENIDADVVIWILPDELDEDILKALNNFRELFYRKPFPSIIVCNFDALEKIITRAPDFWRYRSSIYDLSIEKETEALSLYLLPVIGGVSRPYNQKKLDTREKMINYLLSITKDENERARLLGELATVYLAKYDITKDKHFLSIAETLIKDALTKISKPVYKFDLLFWLGIIYSLEGRPEMAEEVFNKLRKEEKALTAQDVLGLFRKILADFTRFIIRIEELRLMLKKSGKTDKSELHEIKQTADELREDIRKWEGHPIYISELRALSEIYTAIKRYKDAEEILNEALNLAVKYGNEVVTGAVHLDLANLYFRMGNLEKAREYAEHGLNIGKETQDELLIKNAKKLLDKIKSESQN